MIPLSYVLTGLGFMVGFYLKSCGIGFTTSKFWTLFVPIMLAVYIVCRSLGIS